MGLFLYGVTGSVEIDDRTLAHLRLVIMHKLRRSEPFMLDVDAVDGGGHLSFWIHPAVSMQFRFFGKRHPHINRAWVDDLVLEASRPQPLTVTPEPPEPGRSGDE